MQTKLLSLLFAASLALSGCGKKSDDPQAKAADPFVGHWVADSRHDVDYSSPGVVLAGHDNTYTETCFMEVGAAAYVDWHPATVPYTAERAYTRNGELLTVVGAGPNDRYEVRNLTATRCTYIITRPRSYAGSSNVLTLEFHR